MKYILALAVFTIVAGVACSYNSDVLLKPKGLNQCQTGSCSSSCDCAVPAQDFQCRCTYLSCGPIEGKCGGGCVDDEQCAIWAGGDNTCECSWLLECEFSFEKSKPGYETLMKTKAAIKRQRIAEQLKELSKDTVANSKKIANLKTMDAKIVENLQKLA